MEVDSDLVARSNAGEAGAQFALARSVLRSRTATPDEVLRAASLIDVASAAGHAAASEMRAVFEAMGVARPQSWDGAFDILQLAAEQGSRSAQTQLLLLSDPSPDPQPPEGASSGLWAEARRSISLERLMRHGERRALSNAPRIRVIDAFASQSECRWLMERARTMLKAAPVIDVHGNEVVDPSRTNKGTAFELFDMDVVMEIIRARISAATHIPVEVFEPTQILHYSVGQEFKRHLDFLEPTNPRHRVQLESHGQRIATFLIYLNDAFEGGETEFSQIGLRYRGRAGDAIFWANCDMEGRPEPMTLHAGLPPTSGEKWILSQWIRDRVAQQAR